MLLQRNFEYIFCIRQYSVLKVKYVREKKENVRENNEIRKFLLTNNAKET